MKQTLKDKLLKGALCTVLAITGMAGYVNFIYKSNNAYDSSRNIPSNITSADLTKEQFDSFGNNLLLSARSGDYFGARAAMIKNNTYDSMFKKHTQNLMNPELQTEILEWERFSKEQNSKSGRYMGLAFGILATCTIGGLITAFSTTKEKE